MKIKCLIVAMLLGFMAEGNALAQQSKSDESLEFNPHWSIGLQGGGTYTLGETGFGDLISPAFYLTGSYKFNSALGVRVGVGGISGKGYSSFASKGYEFNFIQGNIDAMLDVSSLFWGFNHKRITNAYAFAGAGLFYGFDNDEAAGIKNNGDDLRYLWTDSKAFVAGRLGIGCDFRCSERFSISIEANANILSDHFNSKKAGNPDWHFALLAGINYRINKNTRPSIAYAEKVRKEQMAKEAAAAAAKEAAEKAAAEKAEAERHAKLAADKAAKEAEEAAKRQHQALIEENSENVFFLINSAKIRKDEAKKLDDLAAWLNSNDNFITHIVGYADKETGSDKANMKLSERRANNVKQYLIKAGVAEEKIILDFKGDTVQPFGANNVQNRVVICTLE